MQLVCLCVRYTVRGANVWTNGGVLGSYRHINTWTAAESGDSKHSSFINIQKCIQLLLCLSLVCVTVWVLCYSMQDKELHVLFYNDRLMSFVSNTHLFQGGFFLFWWHLKSHTYIQILLQLSLHEMRRMRVQIERRDSVIRVCVRSKDAVASMVCSCKALRRENMHDCHFQVFFLKE